MQLLDSATDLLGDPAKLQERLARDGYLFLQGVLDTDVIGFVREEMERLLIHHGFAERAGDGVRFSGKTAERSSIRSPRELEAEYNRLGLAKKIMSHPAHQRVFEAVAGEPVDFLPITEYRTRPPGREPLTWHQDGFYNGGLELHTCWIPLSTMTEEIGGIAIADGLHKRGYLHESYPPPRYLINADDIPREVHRTARFEPGDVLVFNRYVVHTGLPNVSADSFRFSVDMRFQGISKRDRVVVGQIANSTTDSLTIKPHDGDAITLRLGSGSRLRDWWGNDIPPGEVGSSPLAEGEVLASHEAGSLVLVRPVTR